MRNYMRIRINNIECRFSQGRYEIVKWYPNEYYGAEEKMLSEGWERSMKDGEYFGLSRGFTTITASCFKKPESVYTIATLEWDRGEDWCNMKTVGNRLLELDEVNRQDFFEVYRLAEDKIGKEAKEKEDEDI